MYLMIIGVALVGLGLVGALASRGRKVRITAAGAGAVGLLLLVVSWTARNPPTDRTERIRSECFSAALELESFDTSRLSGTHIMLGQDSHLEWEMMNDLLEPLAELCIEMPASCAQLLTTNPSKAMFSIDVRELGDALRTGKQCRR